MGITEIGKGFIVCLLQTNSDSQVITQVALFSLIPFSLTFAFVIFIFYRQNRESQIRKQHAELEMRALRAQMNPHFIFNCLNSIYHCLKTDRTKEAGDYLNKFAFLTRRILENSFEQRIPLDEEINLLKAYLDLEILRSKNKFSYQLQVDEGLDAENVLIPMLLIQPFIENSIWHGFEKIENNGLISIKIHTDEKQLLLEVKDNGRLPSGDKKQQLIEGKKSSYGTQIVQDQLHAIEKIEKKKAGYTYQNNYSPEGEYTGREVKVFLPLLHRFE